MTVQQRQSRVYIVRLNKESSVEHGPMMLNFAFETRKQGPTRREGEYLAFRQAVGGRIRILALDARTVLVCNNDKMEEGEAALRCGIPGDFFFAGLDASGNLRGLSEDQVKSAWKTVKANSPLANAQIIYRDPPPFQTIFDEIVDATHETEET